MKRYGLLAALCLSACNDLPQARTESEIRNLAREVVQQEMDANRREIESLKSEIATLSSKLDGQIAYAKAISDDMTSFEKTFNHNVNLDNKAAAERMTARGACGQEVYYDDYNVPRSRNRKCTVADLAK